MLPTLLNDFYDFDFLVSSKNYEICDFGEHGVVMAVVIRRTFGGIRERDRGGCWDGWDGSACGIGSQIIDSG